MRQAAHQLLGLSRQPARGPRLPADPAHRRTRQHPVQVPLTARTFAPVTNRRAKPLGRKDFRSWHGACIILARGMHYWNARRQGRHNMSFRKTLLVAAGVIGLATSAQASVIATLTNVTPAIGGNWSWNYSATLAADEQIAAGSF